MIDWFWFLMGGLLFLAIWWAAMRLSSFLGGLMVLSLRGLVGLIRSYQ